MEKENKKYCVYSHSYNNKLFYIGSGRLYTKEEKSTSRAYNFRDRSEDWFEFCNRETEKIKVEILFQTNDRKESFDVEEHITGMYIERAPLVNKNIGTHTSEETRKKISLAVSGENHPLYGKRGEETSMYGRKHTKESRKRMSEAAKGKPGTTSKKVLIVNNETGEQINSPSIHEAHNFIVEKGYKRAYKTFYTHIRNGKVTFKNYTLERLDNQ